MTTEQHAYSSLRVVRTDDAREASPVCGCGQDLDTVGRLHCPRCGTSLAGHAA